MPEGHVARQAPSTTNSVNCAYRYRYTAYRYRYWFLSIAIPTHAPVCTGLGTSVVAADVLWSDPIAQNGLQVNEARGVGLTFGPDVTQVI